MALIKCTECGHQISDKASVCPNCGCPVEKRIVCEECGGDIGIYDRFCPTCGNPLRDIFATPTIDKEKEKSKSVRWAIMAIIALLIVSGILYSIHNSGSLTANGETTDSSKNKKSAWTYKTEVDPLTDEAIHGASIASIDANYINGVEMHLALLITHVKEGTLVHLGLDDGAVFRSNLPLVYYRIDDGELEHQGGLVVKPNIICIENGKIGWAKKIKASKKIAFKVELADGTTNTFTFNTEGLEWEYD